MKDVALYAKFMSLLAAKGYKQLREICHKLHPADFTTTLLKMPTAAQQQLIKNVEQQIDPEALIWCDLKTKEVFIKTLGVIKVARLVDCLELEDILDFTEGLDEKTKNNLITNLNRKKQHALREALAYPKDSAARVMDRDLIVLIEYWDVSQATSFIKKHLAKKNIFALMVVDRNYRPTGYIELSTLLKASPDAKMSELLEINRATVDPGTDLDRVTYLFKKYSMPILPVINKLGRLVGIISVNSMLYVIDEETEEDLLYMGGILTDSKFTKVFSAVKGRFPWLFVNLATAYVTGLMINQFSSMIAQMAVLASLMPVVASLGGNAAIQAITLTVRGLVKQEITHTNASVTILKEVLISAVNGALLGLIGLAATMLIFQDLWLSVVFSVAIAFNFIAAGFVGSAIPIIFDYFEIDPAAASGVLVTSITDALGFIIFLSLSYFLLL